MEEYYPSEIARLVLGYIKEEKCMKSWQTFLGESNDLQEHYRLLKEGKEYTTNVEGKSLKEILKEYRLLKYEAQKNAQNQSKSSEINIPTPCLEFRTPRKNNSTAMNKFRNNQSRQTQSTVASQRHGIAGIPSPRRGGQSTTPPNRLSTARRLIPANATTLDFGDDAQTAVPCNSRTIRRSSIGSTQSYCVASVGYESTDTASFPRTCQSTPNSKNSEQLQTRSNLRGRTTQSPQSLSRTSSRLSGSDDPVVILNLNAHNPNEKGQNATNSSPTPAQSSLNSSQSSICEIAENNTANHQTSIVNRSVVFRSSEVATCQDNIVVTTTGNSFTPEYGTDPPQYSRAPNTNSPRIILSYDRSLAPSLTTPLKEKKWPEVFASPKRKGFVPRRRLMNESPIPKQIQPNEHVITLNDDWEAIFNELLNNEPFAQKIADNINKAIYNEEQTKDPGTSNSSNYPALELIHDSDDITKKVLTRNEADPVIDQCISLMCNNRDCGDMNSTQDPVICPAESSKAFSNSIHQETTQVQPNTAVSVPVTKNSMPPSDHASSPSLPDCDRINAMNPGKISQSDKPEQVNNVLDQSSAGCADAANSNIVENAEVSRMEDKIVNTTDVENQSRDVMDSGISAVQSDSADQMDTDEPCNFNPVPEPSSSHAEIEEPVSASIPDRQAKTSAATKMKEVSIGTPFNSETQMAVAFSGITPETTPSPCVTTVNVGASNTITPANMTFTANLTGYPNGNLSLFPTVQNPMNYCQALNSTLQQPAIVQLNYPNMPPTFIMPQNPYPVQSNLYRIVVPGWNCQDQTNVTPVQPLVAETVQPLVAETVQPLVSETVQAVPSDVANLNMPSLNSSPIKLPDDYSPTKAFCADRLLQHDNVSSFVTIPLKCGEPEKNKKRARALTVPKTSQANKSASTVPPSRKNKKKPKEKKQRSLFPQSQEKEEMVDDPGNGNFPVLSIPEPSPLKSNSMSAMEIFNNITGNASGQSPILKSLISSAKLLAGDGGTLNTTCVRTLDFNATLTSSHLQDEFNCDSRRSPRLKQKTGCKSPCCSPPKQSKDSKASINDTNKKNKKGKEKKIRSRSDNKSTPNVIDTTADRSLISQIAAPTTIADVILSAMENAVTKSINSKDNRSQFLSKSPEKKKRSPKKNSHEGSSATFTRDKYFPDSGSDSDSNSDNIPLSVILASKKLASSKSNNISVHSQQEQQKSDVDYTNLKNSSEKDEDYVPPCDISSFEETETRATRLSIAKSASSKSVRPASKSPSPSSESLPPTSKNPLPTSKNPLPTSKSPLLTSKSPLRTSKSSPPTAKSLPPTAKSLPPTAKSLPPTAKRPLPTSKSPLATSKSPLATLKSPPLTSKSPVVLDFPHNKEIRSSGKLKAMFREMLKSGSSEESVELEGDSPRRTLPKKLRKYISPEKDTGGILELENSAAKRQYLDKPPSENSVVNSSVLSTDKTTNKSVISEVVTANLPPSKPTAEVGNYFKSTVHSKNVKRIAKLRDSFSVKPNLNVIRPANRKNLSAPTVKKSVERKPSNITSPSSVFSNCTKQTNIQSKSLNLNTFTSEEMVDKLLKNATEFSTDTTMCMERSTEVINLSNSVNYTDNPSDKQLDQDRVESLTESSLPSAESQNRFESTLKVHGPAPISLNPAVTPQHITHQDLNEENESQSLLVGVECDKLSTVSSTIASSNNSGVKTQNVSDVNKPVLPPPKKRIRPVPINSPSVNRFSPFSPFTSPEQISSLDLTASPKTTVQPNLENETQTHLCTSKSESQAPKRAICLSGKPRAMTQFYKSALPDRQSNLPVSPETISSSSCTLDTFVARSKLLYEKAIRSEVSEPLNLVSPEKRMVAENLSQKRKLSTTSFSKDSSSDEEGLIVTPENIGPNKFPAANALISPVRKKQKVLENICIVDPLEISSPKDLKEVSSEEEGMIISPEKESTDKNHDSMPLNKKSTSGATSAWVGTSKQSAIHNQSKDHTMNPEIETLKYRNAMLMSPVRSSLPNRNWTAPKSISRKKIELNPKFPAGVKLPSKWNNSKISHYSTAIEKNVSKEDHKKNNPQGSKRRSRPNLKVNFRSPLKRRHATENKHRSDERHSHSNSEGRRSTSHESKFLGRKFDSSRYRYDYYKSSYRISPLKRKNYETAKSSRNESSRSSKEYENFLSKCSNAMRSILSNDKCVESEQSSKRPSDLLSNRASDDDCSNKQDAGNIESRNKDANKGQEKHMSGRRASLADKGDKGNSRQSLSSKLEDFKAKKKNPDKPSHEKVLSDVKKHMQEKAISSSNNQHQESPTSLSNKHNSLHHMKSISIQSHEEGNKSPKLRAQGKLGDRFENGGKDNGRQKSFSVDNTVDKHLLKDGISHPIEPSNFQSSIKSKKKECAEIVSSPKDKFIPLGLTNQCDLAVSSQNVISGPLLESDALDQSDHNKVVSLDCKNMSVSPRSETLSAENEICPIGSSEEQSDDLNVGKTSGAILKTPCDDVERIASHKEYGIESNSPPRDNALHENKSPEIKDSKNRSVKRKKLLERKKSRISLSDIVDNLIVSSEAKQKNSITPPDSDALAAELISPDKIDDKSNPENIGEFDEHLSSSRTSADQHELEQAVAFITDAPGDSQQGVEPSPQTTEEKEVHPTEKEIITVENQSYNSGNDPTPSTSETSSEAEKTGKPEKVNVELLMSKIKKYGVDNILELLRVQR